MASRSSIGLAVLLCAVASAQPAAPGEASAARAWRVVARDQRAIFASPVRAAAKEWKWVVPALGGLGYLIATDQRTMTERLHTDAQARERSSRVANAGVIGLAAMPAFLYWRGWRHADDESTGAATAAARAAVDSIVAAEVLRLAVGRERPARRNGAGAFETGPRLDAGFPSLHAAGAWSIASVLARRYPGWLTQVGVYGAAAAVSVSRVTGREHFPSDVVAGSLLGFLVGRFVDRDSSHPHPAAAAPEETSQAPAGSAYVPLDSWIYGSLDRLAALGLIPSQTSGLRPWTRDECRRQTLEAERNLESRGAAVSRMAREMVSALRAELDGGAGGAVLESVYTRNGVIAGPVLNDSFHFGQTWSNDSGRPFGRGWNSYTGFTARAESGRFFAYVQGEYQHAPGAPAYSTEVRQTISALDGVPLQPAAPVDATDRFRALDAYVGARLGDIQFSVGKQSLWWGPTYDAPLSFSNNAEPTKNFKASLVNPIRLPGVFRYLGEIRGEFVMGKLGGQSYTWRPWFNAQKLSFKLTENLEMGFTRWSIFWGVGHPITARSFIRNFTSTESPLGAAGEGRTDPGDRKGGFDFRYRVPGLRNWITVYTDSYCDDDPSPLAAPRRAALNPGIFLTHFPGAARLDLRVEAPSTQPVGLDQGGQYNFYNLQYRSGNTNYGYLVGNSVGRDGRAIAAWSTYHFSPRAALAFGYRQAKGSGAFLPGGSTQSDAGLKASLPLGAAWQAQARFQYERFRAPLLRGPQRNLSAVFELAWRPNLSLIKRNYQ
jgi:membrane-associated phospholipid phosphatase